MRTLKNFFSLLSPFSKSKKFRTRHKRSKQKGTKRFKRRQFMRGGWGEPMVTMPSVMKGGWGMPINP